MKRLAVLWLSLVVSQSLIAAAVIPCGGLLVPGSFAYA